MNFVKAHWGKCAIAFTAGWLFAGFVVGPSYAIAKVKALTGKAG